MNEQMKEDIDFLEIVYREVRYPKIRQELIKFHFERENEDESC